MTRSGTDDPGILSPGDYFTRCAGWAAASDLGEMSHHNRGNAPRRGLRVLCTLAG
jgi:hypothetical protein